MGIDLDCNDKSFSISYSGWGRIRENLIKITFRYLEDCIAKQKENKHPGTYDKYMNNSYEEIICEFIERHPEVKNSTDDLYSIDMLTKVSIDMRTNNIIIDALIYFDVGGLFSFCNKSDCEGYYSSGNSLDICNLLTTIKPFVKEYDIELYNIIYGEDTTGRDNLSSIFYESWNNNISVRIY